LDFDETFAHIARFESIHILLAYATYYGIKLYQMNVKSDFLNDQIKEDVHVEQPHSFETEEHHNHVYKLHKVLNELKQAPRAWYECLRDFLIKNYFMICKTDSTLFTRKMEKIYLYAKYILMILSLVLLTNLFVMSLTKS
jgi:hypothetical protein